MRYLVVFFILLASCSPSPVFKAVGQLNQEQYVFEVEEIRFSLSERFIFRINDTTVIKHNWKNLYKEERCTKTGISSWKCSFDSKYNDNEVKVIYEIQTNIVKNLRFYDVYIDGKFVQRINAVTNAL